MYRDKNHPNTSILRITTLTVFLFQLVYVTASCLPMTPACLQPERARVHTRDSLSITSHLFGSSEGCCPAQWEAVGEAGGEAGGGSRGEWWWDEGMRCCCPDLLSCCLETLQATWELTALSVLSDVPDKAGCRHIFCVYMGSMKCKFVRMHTCVFVCPWLPWVFVAGFYLHFSWADISHPPAAYAKKIYKAP